MSSIFGGSKSKQTSTQQSQSQSNNQAYPFLQEQYGSGADATTDALGDINSFLGGDTGGFNLFKDATGYNTAAVNAGRGVAGAGAAAGLLNSGATGKALTAAQSGLDQQYANSYLDRLFQKSGTGLSIGQLISGAGNQSSSTSTGSSNGSSSSKPGIGSFLGQIGAGIAASDRRLKEDITHLYTLPDGLKVYQFRYNNTSDDGLQIGVMADEVAQLRPEALGPVREDGYATVNYDMIWERS